MRYPIIIAAFALLASCTSAATAPRLTPISAGVAEASGIAGIVDDDAEIREFVLRNEAGMTVRFLNYGAVITAIEVPDEQGQFENVVLGYGSESEYRALNGNNLFGAVVGRYAGRIANARFNLDGKEVQLQPNLGKHALHGGAEPGIAFKIWNVEPFKDGQNVGARLTLTDPAGAQNFPGELDLWVSYILQPDNSLRIEYRVTTTEPTALNLTNHSYFNLEGPDADTVEGHLLQVKSERFVATDGDSIPTGEFWPVADTPLDFLQPRRVGERIDAPSPLLAKDRGGYNHSWFLGKPAGSLVMAAILDAPDSARRLVIETTDPSLHIYTGDYFSGKDAAPDGKPIKPRSGIAMETQFLPDSPNRPEFPSTILRPGGIFNATTIWRFEVRY